MTSETRTESARPDETRVGNYFVSNYPPYSFWSAGERSAVDEVLARRSAPGVPLGVYVHVPFCRKRCDFCYFKVYTDKNSGDIRRYLDALLAELAAYRDLPFLAGRKPRFVYFGGGTPSYLSTQQLEMLFAGLQAELPWDGAEEVAFECEPGTLQEGKVHALKHLGVAALVAESFAGLFYRNALNLGLPAVVCAQVKQIRDGDELEIDYEKSVIRSKGKELPFEPIPPHLLEMVHDGGLLPHLEKRLKCRTTS